MGTVADRAIEHRELGRHVAGSDSDVEPSVAQDVEDGEILGQPQRIVERRYHRGHAGRNRRVRTATAAPSTIGDGR